jgi:arsenite-transporting ATPase
MHFLHETPYFLFFTGKGGVGKTSLACASAVRLADSGQRVLLVSTDPASNIAQVFQVAIGGQITPIPTVQRLQALEIDPLQSARIYRERVVAPVRGLLPDEVVKGIEEQLSGACTTEIAAFDEFTSLLTDPTLPERFDHILFDTAPTGHTIRLLQLPGAWSSFLDNSQSGASCLGPLAGLEKQRHRYRQALEMLSDGTRCRMILVARPQAAALKEVTRTRQELQAIGIRCDHLVINGCMPSMPGDDPLADGLWQREQTALATFPDQAELQLDQLPLRAFNMVGVESLRAFLAPAPAPSASATLPEKSAMELPALSTLLEELLLPGRGLIMLMGKGGVGKTTLAAAIALALSRRGQRVHLTTSDPAAHLEQAVGEKRGDITLSRIDPKEETERYGREILEKQGASLDAHGRALLEEDLRSPCTEEIAVFQAFSRLIHLAREQFVVMDTAPTGHSLLLLDATGAYHREVERLHRSNGESSITPMMTLQDSALTRVLLVTLPENTPILEAAGLQEDLRRAGIEPWAWIVNQSLLAAQPTAALLRQRAGQEVEKIQEVRDHLAKRWAVLPMRAQLLAGSEALLALLDNS